MGLPLTLSRGTGLLRAPLRSGRYAAPMAPAYPCPLRPRAACVRRLPFIGTGSAVDARASHAPVRWSRCPPRHARHARLRSLFPLAAGFPGPPAAGPRGGRTGALSACRAWSCAAVWFAAATAQGADAAGLAGGGTCAALRYRAAASPALCLAGRSSACAWFAAAVPSLAAAPGRGASWLRLHGVKF